MAGADLHSNSIYASVDAYSLGCVTVEGQNACRQRAVVGADSHGPAQFLALEH